MGSTVSQFEYFKNAFAEVSRKCNWAHGLIIDVYSYGKFYVADIRGIGEGPPAGTLRVVTHPAGDVYVYVYAGNRIINNGETFPAYEITIRPVSNVKIGGGRRSINAVKVESKSIDSIRNGEINFSHASGPSTKNRIIFDEGIPDFTKEEKYTVKRCACSQGVKIKGACENCGNVNDDIPDYPDDNIADY